MNVGLLYTPVSIYQMTRGALVLFVGIFSVIFLQRRLWFYQFSYITFARFSPTTNFHYSRWASLVIVMIGVTLVGYSGSLIKDAVKELALVLTGRADLSPTEEPELGKVLIGQFFLR